MTLWGKRHWIPAVLLAGTLVPVAHAQAQASPDATVTGKRMPQAEAPRSATCEALAQDPFFRAQLAASGGEPLMGPRYYLPTRLPRSPDYSAPPLVPPGSPLPAVPKSRFGARGAMMNGGTNSADPGEFGETSASSAGDAASLMEQDSIENAVQNCRNSYSRGLDRSNVGSAGFPSASSTRAERGAMSMDPAVRLASANARFVQARSFIASRDTSLPLGFALFDQGRYAESLGWFRKAAAKLPMRDGGDEAALFVGKLYLQGLGAQSDPAEGVRWLKKAALAPFDPTSEMPAFDPRQPERNTAVGEAAVILANLYRRGFAGIPQDLAEARKWYARAGSVGHVPATKMLGDLYYEGLGAPRDAKKAVAYYRQAAALGYPAAQVALADVLSSGDDGVAKDRKAALGWYNAAARYDHPAALLALARAYDFGDGVAADPQLAIGFYKSAALRGNPAAMTAMGIYFYEGKAVPRDLAVARKWFEAAAGSDADGMVDLAAMLAKGEGGPKDTPKAWVLLRRAAALGQQAAPAAAAALERRMTESERRAAGDLARQ
jgi:hypothetical protein